MVNRIGTVFACGSIKSSVQDSVQHETPEEGRRTYHLKCWEYTSIQVYKIKSIVQIF